MGILPNTEFYQGYIGTQKDLTQVTTLNKKVWGSTAKLNWTSRKSFGCEIVKIVNSDRQFCRTVHVISWTVVLVSSSRKIKCKRKISAHVFVSFQDFVGKNKELFCLKPGQIRQRRGKIRNTRKFGFVKWITIGNLFIGELFITSKITFQTMKLLCKGGKGKVKQANSRLTELWASQWYICQAVLKEVNFELIC